MKRIALIILATFLLNGCATFIARSDWRDEGHGLPRFYPATCLDGEVIALPFMPSSYDEDKPFYVFPLAVVGGVIDLPISIATDTLFIPYDIWIYEPPKYGQPEHNPNHTIKADEK